jgi:phosphoserine phosphatase
MKRTLILLIFMSILVAACGGGAGKPEQAVEAYLNALVGRDENATVAASCAAWEEQARQEFNSFSAVKLEMQEVACTQSGTDGDTALVTCTGKIIANYGAEDLQIDVAERTYAVIQEGGAWRMCGYR